MGIDSTGPVTLSPLSREAGRGAAATPQSLGPLATALWATRVGDLSPALTELYHELLCPEEAAAQMRLPSGRARHYYTITRALLRTTLSRYLDVRPRDWRFTVAPGGRPMIAAASPGAGSLSFSISHTEGLVLVGVARGRRIGVDAENTTTRSAPRNVASRYFSAAEVRDLRLTPQGLQRARFFDYWTLKEAYGKAVGGGLAIPLNETTFRFPDASRLEVSRGDFDSQTQSPWSFALFTWAYRYVVAVCVSSPESEAISMTTTQVVPLVGEVEVAVSTFRSTQPAFRVCMGDARGSPLEVSPTSVAALIERGTPSVP